MVSMEMATGDRHFVGVRDLPECVVESDVVVPEEDFFGRAFFTSGNVS